MPEFERIAFVASSVQPAQDALPALIERYGGVSPDQAEVIVALGGDGFMLRTLHRYMNLGVPVFGMRFGTVGFLMNLYQDDGLQQRLAAAQAAVLRPLEMRTLTDSGQEMRSLAINEVSLLRQTKQAAKIRVHVDGKVKLPELVCDGVMVATAAGSTAYNLSAHGPILPLGSNMLALTPLAPFRPRRWRGALLRHTSEVRFEVLDPYKRPVSATADSHEVRDVTDVFIREAEGREFTLLFDPEHNLEERIVDEQFAF